MSAEFDFNPGLDPSSLTSISQAQLLQMVAQIVTLANKGLIIIMDGGGGTSHPDVTNNNRYINYLWIDTHTANNPVLKLYTGTAYSDTYADWSPFAVPNNSITATMLQALSVTIAKMSSVGGNPGQLLSANSANGFDFIDFASLLTTNIIPLTAINKAGAGDGTVLQKVSGQLQFSALDASILKAASVALSQLQTVGSNQLLGANASGVIVGVGAAGSGLVAADVLNYFQPLSVPLTLLAGTGLPATGDILRWNGTNWVKYTPPIYRSTATDIPASAVLTTFPHGLAATPEYVSVRLKCKIAQLSYSINDVVYLPPGADNGATGLTVSADATNVYIIYNTSISITNRSTGARAAITAADWTYLVTAWNN